VSHRPLAAAFLAALPHTEPAGALADAGALERTLAASAELGRARWPAVALAPSVFAAYLAERLAPEASSAALLDALAALRAEDLWLSCGCVRGDPAALAAFDAGFLRDVGAFVAGVDRAPAFADEVRQVLRERLLAGARAKIAEYGGRGALGGWVRVAALRVALDLKRAAAARPDAAGRIAVEDAVGQDLGPELSYLRAHYREAFGEALRASVEALGDRERTLLRLHHVEALPLEAIAALYRVHLSTVSRWLSRAREQVADGTTRRLCERLGVGASAAESIAALVLSQVDVSITRLLRMGR
jgi:RNA polymerase sigma-70 factor, ECF subfamily